MHIKYIFIYLTCYIEQEPLCPKDDLNFFL